MASGTPVLFSCNSINNPVKEARSGISTTPDDPQELASAMIRLYNTPEEERRIMGKRGREYVEKFHNVEELSAKFQEAVS